MVSNGEFIDGGGAGGRKDEDAPRFGGIERSKGCDCNGG